jgi:hypothetical protein
MHCGTTHGCVICGLFGRPVLGDVALEIIGRQETLIEILSLIAGERNRLPVELVGCALEASLTAVSVGKRSSNLKLTAVSGLR